MERNTTQTTGAYAAVLAALLFVTPPAHARARKSVKIDPQAQALMSQGLGSLQRGEYTAAISSLNKAVRKQGTVSSYFLLGWAHYQRGFHHGSVETADRDDAQSAIDAYDQAIALDPKLADLPDASRLYFSLALCDEAIESYDRALMAYKTALRLAPNKALIPLHAARLRLKMKDEDKAMSNLDMALSKARKAGREDKLIALVKRDPAFAPILADRQMRRAMGVSAADAEGTLVASNADFSGEEMRDAVRDTPARTAPAAQDPAVLEKIATGNMEFKFRRYLSAVAAYEGALSLNRDKMTLTPAQVAAVYEKIGASFNKTGASDRAIAALQKSLQQNPMDSGAAYQIALAYAMSGKTAQSLHALKESFANCGQPAELRRLVILSKTDVELEAVRDLPGFRQVVADQADRIALR